MVLWNGILGLSVSLLLPLYPTARRVSAHGVFCGIHTTPKTRLHHKKVSKPNTFRFRRSCSMDAGLSQSNTEEPDQHIKLRETLHQLNAKATQLLPPSASSSSQKTLQSDHLFELLQKLQSAGRIRIIGLLLARPAAAIAFCLIGFSLLPSFFSSATTPVLLDGIVLCFATAVLAPAFTRRALRTPWLRTQSKVQAGVHFCGDPAARFASVSKLRERCLSYRAPWFLPNGDVSSIMPSIWRTVRPAAVPSYKRYLLPASACAEAFATDWVLSKGHIDGAGIVVLLPGIGGGSSEPYACAIVDAFSKLGWSICALSARGLGDSPPVNDVSNIFVPSDYSDLDTVLRHISSSCDPGTPIFLVGVSLGGITLGKYMTDLGEKVPQQVCGAALVSGAFDMEFCDWWRYREVFQRGIVPGLVQDIMGKYEPQLSDMLSELELLKMCHATTYRELVLNALIPIRRKALERRDESYVEETYTSFQAASGSKIEELSRISRPTLLLTALDDPLHAPDKIGIDTSKVPSPYLIYMVTEEGGHVSWPDVESGLRSQFMCDTLTSFAAAVSSPTSSSKRFTT